LIDFAGNGQPENKSDYKNGYDYENDIIQSISSFKISLKGFGRSPIDRPLKEAHRCEQVCPQRHSQDKYRQYLD